MVFHLKPAFGPQVLRSITRDQVQPCQPEGETRVTSPEEIPVALGVRGPRERLNFPMATGCGQARSSLFTSAISQENRC